MIEKRSKSSRRGRVTAAVLHGVVTIILAIGLWPTLATADVILNPVEITGTIRIGTELITSVDVRATSGSTEASQVFTPDPADPTMVHYSLTVDAPLSGDGSRTYAVQPCFIRSDPEAGGLDADQFCFAGEDVEVSDGTPGSMDFIVDPAGVIEGTITVDGVATLYSAFLTGRYLDDSFSFCASSVAPCFNTTVGPGRDGQYRIAIQPANGIRLIPQVRLSTGVVLQLDEVVVDVVPGATVVHDIVVVPPQGAVVGEISFAGPETVTRHQITLSGPANTIRNLGADGPYEFGATRQGWSKRNGGCDDSMKLR